MKVHLNAGVIRWRLGDMEVAAVDLAAHLGISQSQVSRLLSGARSCDYDTAWRMSLFLKMPIELVLEQPAAPAAVAA